MLTPALQQLFNAFIAGASQLFVWRLYTISLSGGGVIRFADSDFDIKGLSSSALVNGFSYPSSGLRVDQKGSKTQAHWKLGLDTDTWTLVVMPRPFDPVTATPFPDTIGNVPFIEAAQAGSLDAADFQVDEAYFGSLPTWPMPPGGAVPVGCKTIFAGVTAEVDTNNAAVVLTVNDYRYLFAMQMPRRFFQAGCKLFLFDSGCNASGNMNAASFAVPGTAAAGSTQAVVIGAGLARPGGSGTYRLGRIQMTGGLNTGFQRTIRNWDGAFTLQLLNPLPFVVAPGDSFQAFPGCDKTFATCGAFNNTPNYGGYLNIPAPEVQA